MRRLLLDGLLQSLAALPAVLSKKERIEPRWSESQMLAVWCLAELERAVGSAGL